jgi:hypothetical protein
MIPRSRALHPDGISFIAVALIWSAWAAACRALGFARTQQSTQHPILLVDEAQPAQFVDTEITWWSV